MPLLSIIVPIYNGEDYVEPLLQSMDRQTDKDFELIVVDDGSTDGTLQRLYRMAGKMSYPIRIEHIAPSGVSAARNYGIRSARGKYISFVDADDCVVRNYVAVLKRVLAEKDFDLYVFQSKRVKENGSYAVKGKAFNRRTSGAEMLHSLAVNPTRYGVYNLFIRRSYLESHKFAFAESFDYYEDYDLLIRLFSAAENIFLSESVLYNYVQHSGSAVSQFQVKRFEDLALLNVLVPYLRQIQPQFAQEYTRWFLPRIWWSLLWQSCFAFSGKDWNTFLKDSNMADQIRKLDHHPDRKVRDSASLFLRSPNLFRCAVLLVGRRHSQVRRTEYAPFRAYFDVVKKNEM